MSYFRLPLIVTETFFSLAWIS